MARLVDQKVMKRGGRALAVPLATILLAGGVVAGCGSSKKHAAQTRSSSTATSTAQSASPRTTVAAPPAPATRRRGAKPTRVAVMSSQYGRVLNAPGGHALYVFTHDTPGRSSTCYGDCAKKWPPFLVKQTPQARDAVKQGLLGTARRRDGRLQATYAGRPLYFYFEERDPGEILCQGVAEFGGTWWVVAPGGKPVEHQ